MQCPQAIQMWMSISYYSRHVTFTHSYWIMYGVINQEEDSIGMEFADSLRINISLTI